jgi:hypothetical protein
MSPETVLGIGNDSLALLGAQTVQQADEGTELANLLTRIAPVTLRACLAAHPWRCTLAQPQLVRFADPPPHSYRYRFALPAAMIAFRRAVRSAAVNADLVDEYRIVGDELHANAEQVWADVQAEPPLIRWPPYLRAFARDALAADLALAVTGSGTDAQLFQARAWGPPSAGGHGGLFAHAKRVDDQQAPLAPLRSFPLLSVRAGGWR